MRKYLVKAGETYDSCLVVRKDVGFNHASGTIHLRQRWLELLWQPNSVRRSRINDRSPRERAAIHRPSSVEELALGRGCVDTIRSIVSGAIVRPAFG